MSKPFTQTVAVSKENGLKMNVNDPMTDQMLKSPEKTAFVDFEKGDKKADGKAKDQKGKTDNEQEIA